MEWGQLFPLLIIVLVFFLSSMRKKKAQKTEEEARRQKKLQEFKHATRTKGLPQKSHPPKVQACQIPKKREIQPPVVSLEIAKKPQIATPKNRKKSRINNIVGRLNSKKDLFILNEILKRPYS